MGFRKSSLLAVALFLLASAQGVEAAKKFVYGYPDYGDEPKFFVSDGHISTFTETPAGDHLIPGTQVFLGRNVAEKKVNPAAYFGLIGALASISSDTAKNKRHRKGVELAVDQLHFADAVSAQLSESLKAFPESAFTLSSDEKKANIVLLPSSRLSISKDGTASISFQINVRIKDPKSRKTSRRVYLYAMPGTMAMNDQDGWFSGGGEPIATLSKRAFDALTKAVAHDMNGQLISEELIGGKHELTSCYGLALARTIESVNACVFMTEKGPSPFIVFLQDRPANSVDSEVSAGSEQAD